MMQTLRKKTRVVLFIALAAFAALIFFQWGFNVMGIEKERDTTIAKVDDVTISYLDYLSFMQMKEEENRALSRDEIWTIMLEEIMWNKLLRKEKISITDDELWIVIRNNPPREVYESEFMQDENGQFDYNKYLELLSAPQSRPWLIQYENTLRRQLPKEKLRSLLSTIGWVSPFEDSMLMIQQTDIYDISFLTIALYRARGLLNLTDEELRKYYGDYKSELKSIEMKVFKYTFFEKRPSKDDTLEAKERLDDVIARVEEGEDFLAVAQEVSDDTSIIKAFEKESDLLPYHLTVYSGLKNGEVSEVYSAPQGFEVMQRVHDGLIYRVKADVIVSPSTIGEISDIIAGFKEAAAQIGFDSAAVEQELIVRKTFPLNPEEITFPVRNKDWLGEFVKKARMGEIGGPFASLGGYYLFTLDSLIPATYPSFEEAKPRVKARVERERLQEVVKERLDAISQNILTGTSLETIAEQDTLITFQEMSGRTLRQIQTALGGEVAGLIAQLEEGRTAPPLVMDWAGYIVRCDKKVVLNFDSSMVMPLQVKRQMRWQYLMTSVFTPEKVEDRRDIFFE